ncbi:MAG: hypothetical protein J1F38_01780 [Muribaculaceae bacterium]|nr:hypothetical protein [Muribaculaceae bacterium]
MKKIIKIILSSVAVILISTAMYSCKQDEPNDSPFIDPVESYESTILIYAVATNSLSGNLVSDKLEMLQAAENIDLSKNNVLIFQTVYEYDENNKRTGKADVSLIKLVKSANSENPYDWKIVRRFSDGLASLNPARISEVINYVVSAYPSDSYGLILWSHSTASQPYTSTVTKSLVSLPQEYSFGQDLTYPNTVDEQINIDVLAKAIPDALFNFIWFDSCYMSNIESIYEMRGKCDFYVGYPTEVLDSGLPYHLVLPQIVGKNKDLVAAADTFFQYYDGTFATIAVIDMNKIEVLADFCRALYREGTFVNADLLKKYSRFSTGPFYDFGEYTLNMAAQNGGSISKEELNGVLDQCILYKNTTTGNYYDIRLNLDPERFSGISTHLYNFSDYSATETYYQSLAWYQSVFR